MPTTFVAYATLVIVIVALVVGFGALWHSRTNRRVLIRILQRKPEEARHLLIEAGVSENEFY